jgi:hypothetical protein
MKTLLLLLLTATSLLAEEPLWQGVLWLKNDQRLTGIIEDVTTDSIKVISKGDVYWFKIADLPAATRGQLGLGKDSVRASDEETAAYTADKPRRAAILAAEHAKAQAVVDRERAARMAAYEYQQQQQAKAKSDMEAFRQREAARRQTEALEQIALEMQIRRLNGR